MRAAVLREILPWLSLLKAGCRLHAGTTARKIDAGEIQVMPLKSGLKSTHLRVEPARDIAVAMNGHPNLALLYDRVNFHVAESVGMNSKVHLERGRIGG